jgi:hypothetical protein
MSKISQYWKGILAFVGPGAVIIGSSVLEGSDGGTAITTAEWVTAAVACVVTGGLVTAKANANPLDSQPSGPQDPDAL